MPTSPSFTRPNSSPLNQQWEPAISGPDLLAYNRHVVAKKTGIPLGTLQGWLLGQHPINIEMIDQLAAACKAPSWLTAAIFGKWWWIDSRKQRQQISAQDSQQLVSHQQIPIAEVGVISAWRRMGHHAVTRRSKTERVSPLKKLIEGYGVAPQEIRQHVSATDRTVNQWLNGNNYPSSKSFSELIEWFESIGGESWQIYWACGIETPELSAALRHAGKIVLLDGPLRYLGN